MLSCQTGCCKAYIIFDFFGVICPFLSSCVKMKRSMSTAPITGLWFWLFFIPTEISKSLWNVYFRLYDMCERTLVFVCRILLLTHILPWGYAVPGSTYFLDQCSQLYTTVFDPLWLCLAHRGLSHPNMKKSMNVIINISCPRDNHWRKPLFTLPLVLRKELNSLT